MDYDYGDARLGHLVGTASLDKAVVITDPGDPYAIPLTDKPVIVRETTTTIREVIFPEGTV
jgi:hypothetical protein